MGDPLDEYITKLLALRREPETARAGLTAEVNVAIDQALIEALPLKQLDKLEEATKNGAVSDGLVEELLAEVGVSPEEIIEQVLDNFEKNAKGEN